MTKVPQGAFKFDIAATRKPDDSEATEIAAGGRASMQEMGDRKINPERPPKRNRPYR